jgi:hypothetical protein
MTAALDWSYDLLDPEERQLLRSLAVFRGSFGLDAAESVCHPDALRLLGSLVAKSMVVTLQGPDTRYRLLESVRLYAEAKLADAGESDRLRSAHRDWYVAWIESLPVGELTALHEGSELAPDADNLLATLDWCRLQGQYDLCARIAGRMVGYWSSAFRVAEMTAWWQALDAGLAIDDHRHRSMALLLRGRAALMGLTLSAVEALDPCMLADPDSWVALVALNLRAMYWSLVDPKQNDKVLDEVRRIERLTGIAPDLSSRLSFYYSRVLQTSSQDEALAILAEWLDEHGARPANPWLIGMLAVHGDPAKAAKLLRAAQPPATALGRFGFEQASALVASLQNHFDLAEQHLVALAQVARDTGLANGEPSCLIGFSTLAIARGDYQRCSRLLACSAKGHRVEVRTQLELDMYARCTRLLGSVLDQDSLQQSREEGAALSVSEALDGELAATGREKQ